MYPLYRAFQVLCTGVFDYSKPSLRLEDLVWGVRAYAVQELFSAPREISAAGSGTEAVRRLVVGLCLREGVSEVCERARRYADHLGFSLKRNDHLAKGRPSQFTAPTSVK